jgi:type I restriction enzyme R subunit
MACTGTRLCPELFGTGKDKQNSRIFGVCGNLEFFSQPTPTIEGVSLPGLSEQLFGLRVEFIAELDAATQQEANDANSADTAQSPRYSVAGF